MTEDIKPPLLATPVLTTPVLTTPIVAAGTDELTLRAGYGPILASGAEWALTLLATATATAYEELDCVGLQPDQSSLYATIAVKQAVGYGGDLCTGAGNREYVRFFADWDGDGDFTDADEDLGVASVAVHDVPGAKPLFYTVGVAVPDHRRVCFLSGVVAVRAVLMYGAIPPAGEPNPQLHWGNIVDTHIQPLTRALLLADIIDQAKIALPDQLLSLVDQKATVSAAKAVTPVETLISSYGDKVPLHRTLAPHLGPAVAALGKNAQVALSAQFATVLSVAALEQVNLSAALGSFIGLQGNTTYEELHCIGLAPDLSAVVGTIVIKEPSGYSGGLCSAGSTEYVSFWADWDDNGTFDAYLGTVTVGVHDETVPAGGIAYSVYLPIDLASHQQPCGASHVAKIRGVLSWATPPSATNPLAAPTWGNALEALVQLPVGQPVVGRMPFLSVVGSMAVTNINSMGYANGVAVGPGFTAVDAPFAGSVMLAGHISNPPDLSAGQAPLTYGLRYRNADDPSSVPQDLTDAFQVSLSRYSGGVWTQTDVTQHADPTTHRFTYLEDLTPNGPGGDQTFVEGFLLGQWATGLLSGRYEVWMVAEIGGTAVESNHVFVQLDNTAPTGHLLGSAGHVFVDQGGTLGGTFDVYDDHLGSWSLSVIPSFPDAPSPASGLANVPAGTAFALATTGAVPGGYVLELNAVDRTIVNSGGIGQWLTIPLGFCVDAV